MYIMIDRFTGELPKKSSHILEYYEAQTAQNTSLYKNDVRGWKAPGNITLLEDTYDDTSTTYAEDDLCVYSSTLYICSNVAGVAAPAGAFDPDDWTQLDSPSTLYKYVESSTTHWYVSDNDCDFVKSPVSGEQYDRVYFTGESDTIRVFCNDLISDPWIPWPINGSAQDYYICGITEPPTAPTSNAAGGSSYLAYLFTLVNKYGEESLPSPILEETDWDGVSQASSPLTITIPEDADPGEGYGMTGGKINLYRTAADGTGAAEFLLVNQTNYNGFFAGARTITDNVADASLGEPCPSETWENPPSGLTGLIGLPNGVFAGFVGNNVYLSEPYIPWGWNSDYVYSFEETVIGLGYFGTTIVVCTNGYPYMLIGNNPAQMTKVRLSDYFPCLSKTSIVMGDDAVFYSSRNGLIRVDQTGARNITFDTIDPNDWGDYNPDEHISAWWFGKYFGFYNPNSGDVIAVLIDFRDGTITRLAQTYDTYANCIDTGGEMYILTDDYRNYSSGDVPLCIRQWEADTINYFNFTWKSKVFRLPASINFAAARVVIDIDFYDDVVAEIAANDDLEALNQDIWDSGDLNGALNTHALNVEELNGDLLYDLADISITSTITFKLYSDGVLKHTENVTDDTVFKLPSGFKGKYVELEISGYVPVKSIEIATSVEELMSQGQ